MTTDLDRLIEAVEAGRKATIEVWAAALGSNWRYGTEAASGSIDGAVALLEALLPGWWAEINIEGDYNHAEVLNEGSSETACAYNMPLPARALLLATLRAYRSTREGG